jgi:hypothetical protein
LLLVDDEMVVDAVNEAVAAGVPRNVIERIVAEEASCLDGTGEAFELSASLAATRLSNAAKESWAA